MVRSLHRKASAGVLPALAAAFLFSGGTVQAQDKDLELADGLLDVRYYDLAEFLYRRGIAAGGESKSAGELGLVKLLKYRARNERDPQVQKKLFDEAIKKFESIGGGASSIDAKFQLGDLLSEKGASAIQQMEVADDETLREQLRNEAIDAYTKVNELFTEVVKEYSPLYLKAKDDETGDIDPKIFARQKVNDLIKAWMLQGESLFHRGRISTSKRQRDQDLNKAIELLEEFVWEFEDRVVGFWGYIFQGRAYTALGRYQDAATVFGAVLDLEVEDFTMDVRMVTYHHYAEALNAATQFAECIKLLDEADEDYPSQLLQKKPGQAAVLEKGKAYAGLQQHAKGIELALHVVNATPPYWRATALGLLAEWAAMDPSVGAKIAFLQGTGLANRAYQIRRDELYYRAIAAFHSAAQRLKTPEEYREYGVKIWKEIGDAYFGLEQYHQAGLAFERGANVEAGSEKERGECAYWAYRAYQERYKLTKPDTFDRALYHNARSYFSATFPNDPRMGNIPFYEARDREDEKRFLQAAGAYERLDRDSEKYEIALARAGGCYYKEFDKRRDEAEKKGRKPTKSDRSLLAQAVTKIQDFLRRTGGDPPAGMDKKKQDARNNARGLSVYYLARIAQAREQYKKVMQITEGFRDRFGDRQRGMVSSVLMLELQTLGKLHQVDEAADKLAELSQFNPRYYLLGMAQQMVASLFDGTAEKLEEKGELSAAAEYRRRAAAFFYGWIKGDEDAQGDKDKVIAVARRNSNVAENEDKGGRLTEALRFYDQASQLYSPLLANAKKMKLTQGETDAITVKLQNCRVRSAEILETMGRLDESIAAWRAVVPLLEGLYKRKPKSKTIVERLASAYSRAEKLQDALDLFATLVKGSKVYSQSWWDAKYWTFEIQFRQYLQFKRKGKVQKATTKHKLVKDLLKNLMLVSPQLGGRTMGGRFYKLAIRAGLKEGWEKYKVD